MRASRLAVIFTSFLVLMLPTAFAENGAVVERGEGLYYYWSDDGEDTFVLLNWHSGFWCDADFIADPSRYQWVTRPDEVSMFLLQGHFFARVWEPLTADEFWGNPWYYLCGEDYVADGIARLSFSDNDENVEGAGANIWRVNVEGVLEDTAGMCESGMVKLQELKVSSILPTADYPACWPDCVNERVFKGPNIKCVD